MHTFKCNNCISPTYNETTDTNTPVCRHKHTDIFNSTIKGHTQKRVINKGKFALQQTKEKCRAKTTTKFNSPGSLINLVEHAHNLAPITLITPLHKQTY